LSCRPQQETAAVRSLLTGQSGREAEDSIRNLTGGKAKRLPAPVNGGAYRIVDADELAKLKAHGIKVKVWLP
jgi:hypothetical protein